MAPIVKFFYASLLAASAFAPSVLASPIDNTHVAIEARDAVVENAVGVEVINSLSVRDVDEHHALEKRVFSSPHVRKAFKVVAGNMITAAVWTFNIWASEDDTGRASVWFSNLVGGAISGASLDAKAVANDRNPLSLDATVTYTAKGMYSQKELIVTFVVKLYTDAAQTVIQRLAGRPTATLDGKSVTVSSWDFPDAK